MPDQKSPNEQLTGLMIMGMIAQEHIAVNQAINDQMSKLRPMIQKATPIGLQALTELVVEEFDRRYGISDKDPGTYAHNYLHVQAMKKEVRDARTKGSTSEG